MLISDLDYQCDYFLSFFVALGGGGGIYFISFSVLFVCFVVLRISLYI